MFKRKLITLLWSQENNPRISHSHLQELDSSNSGLSSIVVIEPGLDLSDPLYRINQRLFCINERVDV